jgi:hypothetical protein
MMKYLKQFLLTITMIAVFAGTSWGVPVINNSAECDADGTSYGYYTNSGSLMFDAGGNNAGTPNFDGVETLINDWLYDHGCDGVDLLGTSATIKVTGADDYGNVISATNALTGIWDVTAPSNGTINFYAIKAGKGYAMYLVNPAASNGSWSTYDLWDGKIRIV